MTRVLKDPLLHFLLVGAILFALAAWRGEWIRSGRERIVIDAEQVAQARAAAELLKGRALGDDEVAALLEPTIRDEVLYREALALKLDANDDEVRRRLIEKMSYLTQDLADPAPSSDAELRKFYDDSPARFETPELVTFDQVFFSPSERGDAVRADAEAGIAALRAGRAPDTVGDHTPLRATYERAPREQVAVLFGAALAEAVFTLPPGDWVGPFQSDFGLHAVRLRARSERRLPPFAEIRDQVAAEFAAQRRRERNEAEYRRMRAHYEIVIEKPSAPSAAAAPPESRN
ncbi:MAG TPA: peptidylprolyl isomerase [Gammaproteobacteria bacterium]|nr:peptidylprolyl isomerase [Gammaproteobacteria bacterium]